MKEIHPIKAGVTLGAVVGAWHLLWSVLVGFGWAQHLIKFVLWMHFIQPIFVVQPFSLSIAALLVIVTSIVGFVVAFVFSLLWNRLHLH